MIKKALFIATMALLSAGTASASAATPPTIPASFSPALISPMAAIMGERQVCVDSAAVRDSDLSHVNSYLFRDDYMNVQDYVAKSTNPGAVYAKGIAHARVGDHFGYVYYDSHTFRNTNGNCV